MDVPANLGAILAQRAAVMYAGRRREGVKNAPVELGEAVSQRDDREPASTVDPAAAFDKLREHDVGRLIDIAV